MDKLKGQVERIEISVVAAKSQCFFITLRENEAGLFRKMFYRINHINALSWSLAGTRHQNDVAWTLKRRQNLSLIHI